MNMKANKILSDSLALAIVKALTVGVSIVSTMILSRKLDLASYGTYSTGNLIVNTATALSAFGLLDAVNYYYNSSTKEEKNKYINTIFSIVFFIGIITAIVIFTFRKQIQNYFDNPSIEVILIYIIFRPVLANLGLGMQNLQVSIGKAKIVAIRNSIISFAKLFIVIITAYITQNVSTIFACMLFIEAISLFFYYKVLSESGVRIYLNRFDINLVKNILAYSIPMGIYIQMNALSRDLDKYVIGFFESTDKLAIYTNASTKLPFDVISGPLLMVLIPILTRCINKGDYKNGLKLFKANIKIGYTITFIMGTIVLALSKPVILFLYGEKYLAGITVFDIYVLVDMMNFISFSIVLGAKGKTKILMIVSAMSLVINLGINYIFYDFFGFVGPAIATVIVVLITNYILLRISAKVFETTIRHLFDWKHVTLVIVELLSIGLIIRNVSIILDNLGINYFVILLVLGILGLVIALILNFNSIKEALAELNRINDDNI